MTTQDLILALYGRISDKGRQGDNFSIPTQLQMMREWGEKQGWSVVDEFSEKESAFLEGLTRSELNKVLELARKGKINGLVFFSADRFTRDMADGVILRRELKRYGVRLFCYYPVPHEITSDMEILNVLTDWQSQQESEKRRDNSMRGLAEKVRLGLYPQGKAPYGYRIVGRKHNTHLEIVEKDAYYIRKIFKMYYHQNWSALQIAAHLNDMKVPSNAEGTGSGWTDRRIVKILANEAYSGKWYAFTWQKVSKNRQIKRPEEERILINIPPIISPRLWEDVREKMRSRRNGRANPGMYLMSCRIRCICGKAMGGVPGHNAVTTKIYYYYRCISQHTPARLRTCKEKQWRVSEVDETVWQFAYELLTNPEKLLKGYRQLQEETHEELEIYSRQIEALTEQIDEQRAVLANMIEQRNSTQSKSVQTILDGQIEKYGAALDELEGRKQTLRNHQRSELLADEEIEARVAEVDALRKMHDALETIHEEADFSAKQALIELLNLRATLRTDANGQKWVDIHWLRTTEPRPLCTQKAIAASR